jgi:hypothetical protein
VLRESSAREISLSAIGKPLIGLIIFRIVQHEITEIISFLRPPVPFVWGVCLSGFAVGSVLDGFLGYCSKLAYRLLELVTDFN